MDRGLLDVHVRRPGVTPAWLEYEGSGSFSCPAETGRCRPSAPMNHAKICSFVVTFHRRAMVVASKQVNAHRLRPVGYPRTKRRHPRRGVGQRTLVDIMKTEISVPADIPQDGACGRLPASVDQRRGRRNQRKPLHASEELPSVKYPPASRRQSSQLLLRRRFIATTATMAPPRPASRPNTA